MVNFDFFTMNNEKRKIVALSFPIEGKKLLKFTNLLRIKYENWRIHLTILTLDIHVHSLFVRHFQWNCIDIYKWADEKKTTKVPIHCVYIFVTPLI